MKLIKNYQELSKLIFSHLKKNLITNCFLGKEEWTLEIQNDLAYYIETEKNLYLFRKRDGFWILNYYLNDLDTEFNNSILNPIVVEFVGRNILENNYQKQQELFNNLGWKKCVERERFEKIESSIEEKQSEFENNDCGNGDIEIKNNSKNDSKIEICLAQEHDFDNVLELLKDSFNPYYGCIPTNLKLLEDINNGGVYMAKINNKIVGILHFKHMDKLAEIRHLAIDKDWRGQGIANELMNVYENEVRTQKKIVWTGIENQAAQGLYLKNGYKKDGYVSNVYMNEML